SWSAPQGASLCDSKWGRPPEGWGDEIRQACRPHDGTMRRPGENGPHHPTWRASKSTRLAGPESRRDTAPCWGQLWRGPPDDWLSNLAHRSPVSRSAERLIIVPG